MSARGEEPRDADRVDAALVDAVHRTGACAGGVYLREDAAPALRLVAVSGVPVESTGPWRRVPLAAPLAVGEAVREDRVVWVGPDDDTARASPGGTPRLPDHLALAAAPLHAGERGWGALLLMWPEQHPGTATRRERGAVAAAARRVARALDDSASAPTLPDHPRPVPFAAAPSPQGAQQAAVDYVERLPEGALALDLEGRITLVSGEAAELLGLDAGRLLGTRPWQALPWLETAVVEDHYRTAVISRAPVSFTVLRPPRERLRFELHPDTSGISVRISRAPASGTGRRATDRAAGTSGALVPGAAPTGRLYQLVHLAAALTETVAVRDVVDLLADQVLPAFGADGLVLSATDAGRLRITGYHGYPRETIERLDGLPLDTVLTPAGQVLAAGRPSFFASPGEMARRYPDAPRISGKQAWAFLPLIVSGRPVGCCILSYDRPRSFSAEERAVLTSLAGLVAQALDRARLYDTTRALARGLQEALLPRTLPALPGMEVAARYLPASHGMDVGGDFYDVIKLDPTTAAAVIGDVQGHNVAAAALMGQVRTAIHATAGAPPDQVLMRTNRVLADLETDLLVSCLYLHIDLAAREAVLASAGHPPPLLHGPGLRCGAVGLDPGPLLGVDPSLAFPVGTVPLPPGTTLALYTDGLVETPGADPEEAAGELARHLARHAARELDPLIDSLLAHARPTGHHTDDIALLLLRTPPTG
ncbi:SpoIIE family protein phosphatase [Streptomyces sp. C10-9-1]|uniref:SpoIIE family protein phosphatase n=1 Tax=Streptomyces sp. C10-9-1 TaxID=1859285 RepID=UPI0021117E3B|nr:SpoIIE family protein phosphatase [Streptomyces sp. C10-9-1]MCQ6554644.1 SpoIIE family protein phosphatase [Streptomyces sp. C10-9-1]